MSLPYSEPDSQLPESQVPASGLPAPDPEVLDAIPNSPKYPDPPRMAGKRGREDLEDDDDSEPEGASDTSGKKLLPYPLPAADLKFSGPGWKVVCTKHGRNFRTCKDPVCRTYIWGYLDQR